MLRTQTIFMALILAATLGRAERLLAQDDPRDGQSQREGRRGFRGDRPGGQGGDAEGGGRRGGGPGGRGFRGRGPDMNAFYDRITKELALDEDQQAQLEEIRAAQRERMESFRQRWEAVREAEQSGDQAKADQLREEMRSDFEQNMGRRRGFMEETVDSIDEILTEDQRTQFTTLRETMRNEREQEMQQRFEQRYDRIAEDLGLDDEQREVLNDIKATQMEQMREFRNRWDAVRQAYDDGDEALGDQLREEMVTEMRESGGPRQFMNRVWDELDPVLTDEQRSLAQELRDERGRRRGNRDRRPPAQEGENPAAAEDGMRPENGAEPTDGGNARTQKRAAEGGDDLQESLELNDEQAASYAALQKAHKAQTAEITTKITQLETQIATAERDGDDAAVERLTAELAAEQEKLAAADEAFYGQLDEMLNDDQKLALAEYRDNKQVDEIMKDIPADLRTVLRAAMRLKLDRSQKERVRQMTKDARNDLKKARQLDKKNRDKDRTAEKALAERYRTRIRNLLTTEQSLKYSENLEKMTPRRNRKTSRGI